MFIYWICLLSALHCNRVLIHGRRCCKGSSRWAPLTGFLSNTTPTVPFALSGVTVKASERDAHLSTANNGQEEYVGSSEYERLSNYFSEEQKLVDKEHFQPLKNSVVRRKVGYEGFIPKGFDLNAIVAVPELFHENFQLRKEDHWETLMQIRSLYLDKVSKEKAFQDVSQRRADLAKAYYQASESAQNTQRESNLKLRNDARTIESQIKDLTKRITQLVETLPNIVAEDVPRDEFIVQKTSNTQLPNEKTATIVPHYEVLERLSHPCTLKAAEISGTGYSAFSGDLARLERALSNFMLDTHHKLFGYKEISVPLVVGRSTIEKTGHLPRFEEDLFKLDERHQSNGERAYLIPTGEVPLIALFGNSRIALDELPVWLMACTPCFRSEIQDYGRQTRGLIRNHQFNKVELIGLCDSENSDYFHDLMISHIEFILQSLELPYRRVLLPATDIGTTSSKTVDFEVFFPSMNNYIEVSSCSNTLDYQSSRLNLFSKKKSKIHCINGSGLAIGRTLSAILENYQTADANNRIEIRIPNVLQPYLDGKEKIREPIAR
ncbi:seryl-tRNA synthetase [Babesia gibsoni]|uniref:Serine--tRNA ligase n=1 Tax=Babesia gibsoni TaxID=33632 RepID=A0AAD8LHN6_BABGI|nr:seryl-tRNA synthetase [Babesia gibsoni]